MLETLVADGVLSREGPYYVWRPDPSKAPHVGDTTLFDDYGPRLARFVRDHEVALHLRRLAVSDVASEERHELYRREFEDAGRPWWLPPELPRGWTFVTAHRRGA
jgi:hypothetical protein